LVMRQSCIEIDEKIEHYRRLRKSITDQITIETMDKLIVGLSAQRELSRPKT
jgi:hypothetical protein